MEDNHNSVDTNAILTELQILNQGVAAENKKVDQLVEYLIVKDQKEKEEKEQSEALASKEKAEAIESERLLKEQEQQAEAEQKSAQDEKEAADKAEQEEVTETYTELLTDIRDGINLSNEINAINGIYIGIVIGMLFIKILVDRIFK